MAEHTYTKSFDSTLEHWLNDRNNPVSETKWNTKRPSEGPRKLIAGILNALYDLHTEGLFHGALNNHENYAITFFPNYSCAREYSKTRVVFLSKSRVNGYEGENIKIGQKKDLEVVVKVIFDDILGNYQEYRRDLQLIRQHMITENCCTRFMADHPALWHWRRRYFYFNKIWIMMKAEYDEARGKLQVAISHLDAKYINWKSKIPQNTPIERLFNVNFYGAQVPELLRFLRILFEHIFDIKNNKKIHIDEVREKTWLDMQYIEHEVTKMFPLFLVDFCYQLSLVGLYY